MEIVTHDDRLERPSGARPQNRGTDVLPAEYPPALGYNRAAASGRGEVLATVDNDPLLIVGDHGDGRAFAYTTDCVEHWAPSEFLEWEHLPALWKAILSQVA